MILQSAHYQGNAESKKVTKKVLNCIEMEKRLKEEVKTEYRLPRK